MPWGVAAAAVGAIGSAAINSGTASANAQAAQNMANQDLGYTSPYNLSSGFGNTYFNSTGSGNSGSATLSGPYQQLESGLLGGSNSFLNSLSSLGKSGGISPLLSTAYNQYQSSMPNAYGQGYGSLYNQAFNPLNTGTGNAFTGAANGMLGSLSSYNPQAAGQQYSNLLAQQQAPGNTLAAQNLTQQLANSGVLGATGGANALQALGTMQGQQYVSDQLAGQQLGMQNQSLMGSLASQFGNTGAGINANNFNMGSSLNNTVYGRQYNAAQQGYQNLLGLNTAGMSTLGTYGSLGTGLLSSGMGIDSALLNQANMAAGMGAERTGAANNATGTTLLGQVAANNVYGSSMNGLLSAITGANYSGLFGGTSPSSMLDTYPQAVM